MKFRFVQGRRIRSGKFCCCHIARGSTGEGRSEALRHFRKLGGALQEADETQLWRELLREE